MKAIADVAKTWNTYVAAHIFTDEAIQTAPRAGLLSIEHGMLIEKRETLETGLVSLGKPDPSRSILIVRRVVQTTGS